MRKIASAFGLQMLLPYALSSNANAHAMAEQSHSSRQVYHRCSREADTSSIARAMCASQELDRQSILLSRAIGATHPN
jgi:hypothetical protein